MKITFVDAVQPDTPRTKPFTRSGAIVVTVAEDRVLGPAAAKLDQECAGALTRAIGTSRFTGKKDQTLQVLAPAIPGINRILLVGIGKPEEIDILRLEALGGVAYAALAGSGETEIVIDVAGIGDLTIDAAEASAAVAFGALLRTYRFDKYRTKERPDQKPSVKRLTVATTATASARKVFALLEKQAEAIFFTRDLVSEPGNVIYPESFADACSKLESTGLDVEILDEKRIRKLGMGALIGVAQGSVRQPRIVILSWQGAKEKNSPPVVFVGKGITFDTGGISIKPAGGMEDMKFDMGGAGTVAGLLRALAGRKAKANVVGICVLAENMPDGNAQRPGDIVTSMSGQTIEVINTDAEGRLVLADALWYAQDRFKPRFMVDLATLTGAILVALGTECAGLFSNDDELADRIYAASKSVGEPVWRLPLLENFEREIDSDAADMKNVASGRYGGSIVGAIFLQRFVNKVPWAHLDIAGAAWGKRDTATVPKGATGFGVRLLDRLVADHYED